MKQQQKSFGLNEKTKGERVLGIGDGMATGKRVAKKCVERVLNMPNEKKPKKK